MVSNNGLRRVLTSAASTLAMTGCLGSALAQPAPAATRPPNIIYILADDLGWRDVGYNGSEIRTPNIDRLAAAGVKLDQYYVQPLCSPTRACLMTGRYPMRQGLQTLVIFPWADYGLPRDERTLPQALKEVGYTTYITGKWHLGHAEESYLPMARGFDHQYGFYNGALMYFSHEIDGGLDWHRDQKILREEGYTTQLIGKEAAKVITEHDKSKPMFLYVTFNAPHAPLEAPKEYIEQYKEIKNNGRRVFAAMTTCMDDEIGKINDALVKAGQAENTIFIFSSDNGGVQHLGGNNLPLRGGKGTYYEGGMRVSAFISWPGKVPAGQVIKEPMHITDWYPTLIKLAGGKLDPAAQPKPVDGLDIWPTIAAGKPTPHAEILHNVTPTSGSIRVGDWKLIVNSHYLETDEAVLGLSHERRRERRERRLANDLPPATTTAPAPATRSRPGIGTELYNIAQDPLEKKNLAGELPDKVKELRARLDELAKGAVKPMNKPEPANFPYPKEW